MAKCSIQIKGAVIFFDKGEMSHNIINEPALLEKCLDLQILFSRRESEGTCLFGTDSKKNHIIIFSEI